MDIHEKLLSGLNDEQRGAVTAPSDTHHLILAGAGCGKTMVLTRRIVYLAARGIPLQAVLALTFTRKAADEMAERVAKLTRETGYAGAAPTITTFHAFALQVLSASFEGIVNFHRIGFTGTPHCGDDGMRLRLLTRCSTPEERRLLGCDVSGLDALLERYHLSPDDGDGIAGENGVLLRSIAAKVQQCKQQEGVWDFSDLVEGAVALLEGDSRLAAHIREQYRAVLVDEFQDTNPLQVRLLDLLLADGKRLFAVGDDDQAIYGFRGADIRPTLEFGTHFPGARILKLQTNYRSLPAILTKANRIFRHKDPAYRKVLVSGRYPRRSGIMPTVHRFQNQQQAGDWILRTASYCSGMLNLPVGSMAVLLRTNQSVAQMMESFRTTESVDGAFPQVLTVHKSKGLEFPVVFLADMEECVFPGYRKPADQRIESLPELLKFLLRGAPNPPAEILDEETRLFYVAVTRAQQRLFLVHTQSKSVYGRTRRFQPSRFLKYMR
jgi:DNA helicase II / ATP-dependent DNA helicase PcrA